MLTVQRRPPTDHWSWRRHQRNEIFLLMRHQVIREPESWQMKEAKDSRRGRMRRLPWDSGSIIWMGVVGLAQTSFASAVVPLEIYNESGVRTTYPCPHHKLCDISMPPYSCPGAIYNGMQYGKCENDFSFDSSCTYTCNSCTAYTFSWESPLCCNGNECMADPFRMEEG